MGGGGVLGAESTFSLFRIHIPPPVAGDRRVLIFDKLNHDRDQDACFRAARRENLHLVQTKEKKKKHFLVETFP